jgi:hypothetical protein
VFNWPNRTVSNAVGHTAASTTACTNVIAIPADAAIKRDIAIEIGSGFANTY